MAAKPSPQPAPDSAGWQAPRRDAARSVSTRHVAACLRWLGCNDSCDSWLAAQLALQVSCGSILRPLRNVPSQWRSGMTPPMNSPAIKVVKSAREQVSPEEWQTRVDLAACYRLTSMYGMTQMIATHMSYSL